MHKYQIIFFVFISALFFNPSAGQTPLTFRDTTLNDPQTFAMIMGVSNYKYIRPLKYADKDAELFRDYLQSPGGGNVPASNIFCLLNENAINANFWSKGFQWLRAKGLKKGDRLFIYLAGHGDAIDEDQFFFLSYDCNPAGDKNNYLVGGTIQLFNLKKKIASETAKGVEVVFIMDACRSNELPGGVPGQNFLNTAVSEKRAGEIIMLATGAGQASLEDASIGSGHGLFTYYLVDGLNGMADSQSPDQKITYGEIEEYVNKNVPSVAQQRFKRNQQPYFCCNENSDKVISNVDTSWLHNWIKRKQTFSGGNSFSNIKKQRTVFVADTTLIETYNRFYAAIRSNSLEGTASAEDYYNQLLRKFPGNPYTLDAQSTLAASFINDAQQKINDYLTCSQFTDIQQRENYQSGLRLEKAIGLVKDIDIDFAESLKGRMYLLKTNAIANPFPDAYAALNIDPNGAYILNRLARMHLDAGNKDSALFYGNKATIIAPNWNCAATTLSIIHQYEKSLKKNIPTNSKKNILKNRVGYTIGAAVNQSRPAYSGNSNGGVLGVNSRSAIAGNIGFIYGINLSNRFALRPAALFSIEDTRTDFIRRNIFGETFTETISIKSTSGIISIPFIFRVASKSTTPYFIAGLSINYLISQDNSSAQVLPVKRSMIASDFGIGVDIEMPKSSVILSPELKYSIGLSDIKAFSASANTASLSSLKRNQIQFSLLLRKK